MSPAGLYEGTNGAAYYQVMAKRLVALGVTTLLQHKAIKLIQAGADGPIVGIEVQDIAAGKTVNIRARRAVFLGSGGFKSNVAMRVAQDPRLDEDFSRGRPALRRDDRRDDHGRRRRRRRPHRHVLRL